MPLRLPADHLLGKNTVAYFPEPSDLSAGQISDGAELGKLGAVRYGWMA